MYNGSAILLKMSTYWYREYRTSDNIQTVIQRETEKLRNLKEMYFGIFFIVHFTPYQYSHLKGIVYVILEIFNRKNIQSQSKV